MDEGDFWLKDDGEEMRVDGHFLGDVGRELFLLIFYVINYSD
jgi:hypothetical protein